MQALAYNQKITLINVPEPERKPGYALIKTTMAGICNTDLEIVKGYMLYKGILGHEFVGLVDASDMPELIGKRVVGEINLGCGECNMCRKGLSRHCSNRSVLGIQDHPGAFAEYMTLPDHNLQIVPDSVADEQAVFVEPLAAALEILEQVHIQPEHRVAVIGDGKLALLIVQVLSLYGCNITIFGKHEHKLALAENYATLAHKNRDFQNKEKYDLVVEASGDPSGFLLAQDLVVPRGTIILKSTVAENTPVHMARIVIDEITVLGSRCGQFGAALRLLAKNKVNVQPLIEAVFPFQEAEKAFEKAGSGALKVLLNFK